MRKITRCRGVFAQPPGTRYGPVTVLGGGSISIITRLAHSHVGVRRGERPAGRMRAALTAGVGVLT